MLQTQTEKFKGLMRALCAFDLKVLSNRYMAVFVCSRIIAERTISHNGWLGLVPNKTDGRQGPILAFILRRVAMIAQTTLRLVKVSNIYLHTLHTHIGTPKSAPHKAIACVY